MRSACMNAAVETALGERVGGDVDGRGDVDADVAHALEHGPKSASAEVARAAAGVEQRPAGRVVRTRTRRLTSP